MQALASAQQEMKFFLGDLLERVAEHVRAAGAVHPGEGETLDTVEAAAAGSLRQMQEAVDLAVDWLLVERTAAPGRFLAVVGALLEKVYINSTSIDDAQFLVKELALRVERWRQGETADASEWDEIACSWRGHRAQRTNFSFDQRPDPGDARRAEAESEAVQLMERLIAERDEAAKQALRQAAEFEAELETQRAAASEYIALLGAAARAQEESESQLASLSAEHADLQKKVAAYEEQLKAVRAECQTLAKKLVVEEQKTAAAEENLAQVSDRLRQRDAISEIIREREEFRSLFANLEAKNEEIKALLPFRERSEFHQKEAQRLAGEREQTHQELIRLHEEVRRLRGKVRSLNAQNDELTTQKLLLEHRASQRELRQAQLDRSFERNFSLRSPRGGLTRA